MKPKRSETNMVSDLFYCVDSKVKVGCERILLTCTAAYITIVHNGQGSTKVLVLVTRFSKIDKL